MSANRRARSARSLWAFLLSTLLVAGCATAPEFRQPAVEVPDAYKQAQNLSEAERGRWKEAAPADHLARGEWWTVFGDAALNRLEEEAIAANPNLQAAAARVKQARATLGFERADRWPQAEVGFGPSRQKQSAAAAGRAEGTDVPPRTLWRAQLGISYEVDLFGRVANAVSAAESDLKAQEALYHSVLLALQADLAQTYYILRQTDAELEILRATVRTREDNVRLLQSRFDAGDIAEFDLARAKTERATTRSELLGVEQRRVQLEHALALLLGRPPAAFELGSAPLTSTIAVPVVPAGLPSALLERRPDIAGAQRAMEAANARIGVARSAFFPSLVLTGSGGFESEQLGDLFRWSSRTWALGPLFGTIASLTLFDGGRRRANVSFAEARLEQSVADYRQRVLGAFGEIEDTLAGLRALAEQARLQDEAIAAAERAAQIADARYRAGFVSFLDVIDAQRSLLQTQRAAAQIHGVRHASTVTLIRALGGGWEGMAPADGAAVLDSR